jgi:SAM-dependent methyltransferase
MILKDRLIRMAALIQQLAAIYPHDVNNATYTLPAFPTAERHSASPFPIPPGPLWASYCTRVETYLQSGEDDIAEMKRLLDASGAPIGAAGRILEIGVAGGRMMRHLADLAQTQEIWGIDHWATAILWCKEHLSPPFNFATTTVTPHLPFEDNYFGLVFAGSVWTHLDDLAEAWALEARRVLRRDGRFYFTVNDRSAVKVFQGGGKDRERYLERVRPENWEDWLALLKDNAGYQRFARGEAQMVTMGRSTNAHVLWDSDYLIRRLGPGWRVCSVTPEAYGHQTGVLLAKT